MYLLKPLFINLKKLGVDKIKTKKYNAGGTIPKYNRESWKQVKSIPPDTHDCLLSWLSTEGLALFMSPPPIFVGQ
jgi:hypothetical protein